MSYPGTAPVPGCTCCTKPACSQYSAFLAEIISATGSGASEAAAIADATANLPAFTGTFVADNPATAILAECSTSETSPGVWGAYVSKSRIMWRITPKASCYYRMRFEVTTWDGVTASYAAHELEWDAQVEYGDSCPCFPTGFDWGDATTYPTLPTAAPGYIEIDIPAAGNTRFIRITGVGPHSYTCVRGITGVDLDGLDGYPFPDAPNRLE